jgi:two-component system sensor histidine kinase AlgZ
MLPFRLFKIAFLSIERYCMTFFSKEERWFHLVMVVVFLPVGNYLNFGPYYLSSIKVFLLGTLCGTILYSISIILLTLLIRRIIALYPNYQQTVRRTVVMTLLVNAAALLYNTLELYIFSLIPLFYISFDWNTLRPMWMISVFFVSTLCIVINLLHAYTHWMNEQTEVERLRNQSIQQQFDALKQQVNPHFLFNSLSSISALVGEDPAQAERFVDKLAKVYRYMLQAKNQELIPLFNELTFIQTYADILHIRYGDRIRITSPDPPPDRIDHLPPLSLQTLIDNVIKHNSMSASRPLLIDISIVERDTIQVTNTIQRKTRRLDVTRGGLANLIASYHQLTIRPVLVEEVDATFRVTLPLLQTTENTGEV